MTVDIYTLFAIYICSYFRKFNQIFRVGINKEAIINNKPIHFRKVFTQLLNLMLKKVDVIIFTSNKLRQNTTSILSLRNIKAAKVIFNGIKTADKYSLREIKDHDEIIISMGRFDKQQKDFVTIIKAFAIVRHKYTDNKLIIMGEGSDYFRLHKLIFSKQLNKNVLIKKWSQSVYKELENASIFLYSSIYEGFGYVILEAMSVGLPVIATNTPYGPSEILGNGKYGILVPMKDPEAMANAIFKLIENKKLREKYSKLSLQRAQFFSEEKMLRKYNEVFTNLYRQQTD